MTSAGGSEAKAQEWHDENPWKNITKRCIRKNWPIFATDDGNIHATIELDKIELLKFHSAQHAVAFRETNMLLHAK